MEDKNLFNKFKGREVLDLEYDDDDDWSDKFEDYDDVDDKVDDYNDGDWNEETF